MTGDGQSYNWGKSVHEVQECYQRKTLVPPSTYINGRTTVNEKYQ